MHFLQGCLLALLLFGASSCSTDIDLNAPYQKTAVVFGLLDAQQDTQWVRINRTWLGSGDQFDSALIADSSEYAPEELTVLIKERVGASSREWTLLDTLIENKETAGIFYGPEQQMWYFIPEGGLDTDAEYDLDIAIANEANVTSTTNMIAEQIGNITQPPPGVINYKVPFVSGSANTGFNFPDVRFKWNSTPGASRYDAKMLIHLTERQWSNELHTDLLSEETRVIEWPLGTVNTQDDGGGDEITKEVSGERFFTTLSSKLEVDPTITRVLGVWDEDVQIARVIDFILTVANDELATYLEINSPVTGVIQERPEYTNINGGLGLFASRSSQGVFGMGLKSTTFKFFESDSATSLLNFCSPNPFSEFYCD